MTPTGHGDATVSLVEGQTFCRSGRTGDMSTDAAHGLFLLDTRVLSHWELRVDGRVLEPLSVDVTDPFTAEFVGRAHPSAGHADADIVVFRRRDIGSGMRERLSVVSYGLEVLTPVVELSCDVDFADLFEVKEGRSNRPGHLRRSTTRSGFRYRNGGSPVTKAVDLAASEPATLGAGTFTWRPTLAPRRSWEVCLEVVVSLAGEAVEPRFRCTGGDTRSVPAQRIATWRARLPSVDTDHVELGAAVRRAGEDLGALRIFDPEHPDTAIVAAGAPWFMTVFGRDSLLTGWMTLLADPTLARGVLETLARFQGSETDPATEEEPGRILHEMRFGGSGGPPLRSGQVYYGSIDATPLFVMLLGEARRWGLGEEIVRALLPHADRALEWIGRFGDRDGDGYVEYQRADGRGLVNQGWKDSWDAIRGSDGELARAPIALCEVQGYVYAAFTARAQLAREAGDQPTFDRYSEKAATLRRRFNADFWLERHGWYALGLDADKRPIDALASNVGHCLWTGIIDEEHAEPVARRLMSGEMFSGWGIRTLATSMRAYNPVSYHNGSVWPHDNALCAAGLARYDFVEAAHRVIGAQIDVAAAHDGRLPELFAGFDRGAPPSPAAYPTSCSPQAWAAAAPLLWLRTLLGLDPCAPAGQVLLRPELPDWMQRLRVDGVLIGGERLTVAIEGDRVEVTGSGSLDVIAEPGPPPVPVTMEPLDP